MKAMAIGLKCAMMFTVLIATLGNAGEIGLYCRGGQRPVPARPIRFAVFSDPHYYDSRLGTEGAAFEDYLAQDRKMIRESHAILEAAIDGILEKDVDFVLVPGDLTKDGERRSHRKFAWQLERLERRGIPVYVAPGNHDINNPDAFAFDEGTTTPVPNVSPETFKHMYCRFGYGEAIRQDPNSLSYLVEPVKGLWVISIDSCLYEDNEMLGHSETGGRISAETMAWILGILDKAKTRGKRVIGFMHHGALEHFAGQSQLFSDYVIDDWQAQAETLAQAGLRMVFTGHFHSHDITSATFSSDDGDATIYDVETGSLVTYPSAYRTVTILPSGCAQIETDYVTETDYDTGGVSFPNYAFAYLQEGLFGMVTVQLMQDYGLLQEQAEQLAPLLTAGFLAHYAGDEEPDPVTLQMIMGMLNAPDPRVRMLGGYLYALWTDLPPADSNLTLRLGTE